MLIKIFQNHTQAGVMTVADPVNGTVIDIPEEDAEYVLAAEGARRAEIVKASKRPSEAEPKD